MEKIIKLYKETIRENIEDLEKILRNDIKVNNPAVNEQLIKLLNISCENLTSKWASGRKYVRTLYVKKAFSNYPENILKLSISIDAIINLLDDVLDEQMNKQTKTLYLVELIRIFSIYNYQKFNEKISNAIGNYFNKIISIAILEEIYKSLIKSESDFEKIIQYSVQIYDCRSLDIDIYTELPMIELDYNKNDYDNILKISRIFRAVNLIKKDIGDIRHDKENETETVMTIFYDGGKIENEVKKILKIYKDLADEILLNEEIKEINNFYRMINEEIDMINKIDL